MSFNPEKTAAFLMPEWEQEQIEKLNQSVTAINDELGFVLDGREVCSRIRQGFEDELGIDLREGGLTSAEEKIKEELMKKYRDNNWNIERKKYFKAA
jgi:lipoate-protein ligase A